MWEIVGQPKAVGLLKRSLELGHLAHAYLLVGPKHVGKMTLAINLAQAVNCGEESPPCSQCPSCVRIASGRHADVQVIGLAPDSTEIGIDQIRQMQHAASLKPYEGKHRVFVIDGAEHLSTEASNSLLKTLEEPPPNVLLILLAVKESLLLPTVLSRCQRVGLYPVPASVIEQALVKRWMVEPGKAEILSRLCGGSIGWALSALADERLLEQRSQNLTKLIGLATASQGDRFTYAAQLAALFGRDRGAAREMLDLWMGWWRDLLLVKGAGANLITNIDQEAVLGHQAEDYSLTQIVGFIQSLDAAAWQLDQNANPRLVFEVLMMNIPPRGRGRREKEGMQTAVSL